MILLSYLFLLQYLSPILSQNLSKKCCPNNFNVSVYGCVDEFQSFTKIDLDCDPRWLKSYALEDMDEIEKLRLSEHLEYCVDSENIYTCPCKGKTCVNVCCEPGETFNYDTQICENSTQEWMHWSIENYFVDKNSVNPTVLHKIIVCPMVVVIEQPMNIKINKAGVLSFTEEDTEDSVNPEDYCISVVEVEENTDVSLLICGPTINENPVKNLANKKDKIYALLLLIGAIFLLATLLVYAMLPELRRAVQGLSLMSHCACMLVAHLALIILKLEGSVMEVGKCHVTAYVVQYSFLSGFFWMNVICIDIASKFRSLQSMVPRTSREFRKFWLFAIYAMGCPFLLFIITISLNMHNDKLKLYLRPGIGIDRCWFNDDHTESISILLYFYLPIGLLILFNLALFIFTALRIFSFTRDTQYVTRSKNNDKTSFVLFVKLFILMGLPWLTEIISWGVGGDDIFWYFTDALNILRSVFIFILFCCKSRVWDLLKARFLTRSSVEIIHMRKRSLTSNVSNSSQVTQSVTAN